MKRVIIFWGYSNFLHTALDVFKNDAARLRDLDYSALVNAMVDPHNLIKVYFACSHDDQNPAVLNFFEWVDYQPYFYVKVFERRLSRRSGRKMEKQVDVNLATQMDALAYEHAFDISILISGDEDFIPAVEIIQQKGKVVIVASGQDNLSSLMKRKADTVIMLDDSGACHLANLLKEPRVSRVAAAAGSVASLG